MEAWVVFELLRTVLLHVRGHGHVAPQETKPEKRVRKGQVKRRCQVWKEGFQMD